MFSATRRGQANANAVARIGALLRRAEPKPSRVPSFLDPSKSELFNLLRTKLW